MRRLNLRVGISERMNEIIGTDYPSYIAGSVAEITPWSIQAAMIENTRRLVRGIVGDSSLGRILRGMSLGNDTDSSISISAGIAITKSGNIIVLNNGISKSVSGNGSKDIYIKHILVEFPESSTNPGGKKAVFNMAVSSEIVYDDLASISLGAMPEGVIDTDGSQDDNSVYIGTIVVAGGKITEVIPTTLRGFGDGTITLDGINSKLESTFDGQTTINDDLDITGTATVSGSGSELIMGADSELSVMVGASKKPGLSSTTISYVKVGDTAGTLVFEKGLLITST
jgi:hypothetical protein